MAIAAATADPGCCCYCLQLAWLMTAGGTGPARRPGGQQSDLKELLSTLQYSAQVLRHMHPELAVPPSPAGSTGTGSSRGRTTTSRGGGSGGRGRGGSASASGGRAGVEFSKDFVSLVCSLKVRSAGPGEGVGA